MIDLNGKCEKQSSHPEAPVIDDPARSGRARVLAFAIAIQVALLSVTFPLIGWTDGSGLFNVDHPYHLYQVTVGRALLDSGSLVGYDPYFGAGNVGGAPYNISAKLLLLIFPLLPKSVPTDVIYVAYVLACALVAPAIFSATGIALRWPVQQIAVLAVLGIAFWWLGAFRWYHTAGMVSFVCASFVGILYSVWVFRVITDSSRVPWHASVIGAGVTGGLTLWLHPLSAVICIAVITALLVGHVRRLSFSRVLIKAVVIAAITLVINLPWVAAMQGHVDMAEQPYQKEFGINFLASALAGNWKGAMSMPLYPIVASICAVGLFVIKPGRRSEFLAFFGAGAALICFGAFGAMTPLAPLQPNRFLAAGFLTWAVAASYVIEWSLSDIRKARHLPSILVLIASAIATGWVLKEVVREVTVGDHGRYGQSPPELKPAPPAIRWVEESLKTHASVDGRVLFETSLGRAHGGGHVAGYLALKTGLEFIGAAYPFQMPERSFWDNMGFGVRLDQLSDGQLLEGIENYNIGWVVAHSASLQKRIAAMPRVKLIAERHGIKLFLIDREMSFARLGEAKVISRSFDRVEIEARRGDALILLYHWTDGLKTTPPLQITPVALSANGPPFVRIEEAAERFVMQMNTQDRPR